MEPGYKQLSDFQSTTSVQSSDLLYSQNVGTGLEQSTTVQQLQTFLQAATATSTLPDAGTLTSAMTVPVGTGSGSSGLVQTALSKIAAWVVQTYQGFAQRGTGAVAMTVTNKLTQWRSIDDYGADPTGVVDSSAAILAAFTACISSGVVKFGIFGDGTYRISQPIVLNANENINLNADLGSNFSMKIRTITPDAGIGAAITICNMRRPIIDLTFSGGGNGSATDIGIQWYNVEAMRFHIAGSNYNGLLCNYSGTMGSWTENVAGTIHARHCYKAFNFDGGSGGNSGTGQIDMIWDVLPAFGSNFANLSDLSVEHYENTIIASVFQATTSLGLINLSSAHFGKLAIGTDHSPQLVWINSGSNISFDEVYVTGGNAGNGTSTTLGMLVTNAAMVSIGQFSSIGCQSGLLVGGGANIQINKFKGLTNTNDIVIAQNAGSNFGIQLSIDDYFSQAAWAESILAQGVGLFGDVTIKTGRIRKGNAGAAATAAINTSPSTMTSSALFTRLTDMDIDVEPNTTPYPISVLTFVRSQFIGHGNRFLSTVAVQDSFGAQSGWDGRSFIMATLGAVYSTWVQNTNYVPLQIWVPFRFETTAAAGDYCTLQLKAPNGTIYDLVDTRYNPAVPTVPVYFTLKALVPAGWSWQFLTSSSAHVTFQGTARSMIV